MRNSSLAVAAACLVLGGCTDTETLSEPAWHFSLAAGTYDCSAQTQLSEAECEALVALYNSTNGPEWTVKHFWLQTDPCGWTGVWCSQSPPRSVMAVFLHSNGLTGTLPPEIGNLTNLETLLLSNNALTGPLPAELGNLAKVGEFYLDHNQFTGPIPPELGNLASVYIMQLDHNQLTGPIPPELGNMAGLLWLDMQSNHLAGPIPPELGRAESLQGLLLSNNQLMSPIPEEVFAIPYLYTIDLRWNQLSGLLPIGVAVREPPQCRLAPGNVGLYVPDTGFYRSLDHDNDGTICGLSYTPDPSVVAADIATILDDLVATGILNGGRANALGNRIDSAMKHLDKGRNAQAVAQVQNFIEQVENLTGAVLAGVEADELILRANILIELVSR